MKYLILLLCLITLSIIHPKFADSFSYVPVKQLTLADLPKPLQKVALCESGGHQFNADGSVKHGIVHPADTGIMQINMEAHAVEVKKMGLDVDKESDNLEFGLYLYNMQGLKPWLPSKPCWSKITV